MKRSARFIDQQEIQLSSSKPDTQPRWPPCGVSATSTEEDAVSSHGRTVKDGTIGSSSAARRVT